MDTKLSVVLGINLGILAMLATRIPSVEGITPLIAVLGVAFFVPLTTSFWHVWWGYFPDLRGGTESLIFFHPISQMTESEFRLACARRGLVELEGDILNQCWRNSKILTCKFSSLRKAYLGTLIAIAPWMALITVLPATAK
ncbi:Pycsar system effector family protein [Thermomonas haemolytica]|uniref:Pycsar system effector family protein n=1 Tax=Thermomonas haemolytica TaxID=141949 RepID=UPI000E0DEBDE|nr:Pycsar system effector family protein [Thermomonas haemolytica]TNY29726.1 hypothetical protein BV505_03760 [Thermomonas haemolytica]